MWTLVSPYMLILWLCSYCASTWRRLTAAREMWISSYIGPHSHMEAIKHHYLNIDIQQRLYLVFRKHSDDNWQVMAWLVLVASVCLSFSTSKLQFVMKVKFHAGQAFKVSLPRPNTHPSQPPAQSLRTHINQNWQVIPSGLLGTSKI